MTFENFRKRRSLVNNLTPDAQDDMRQVYGDEADIGFMYMGNNQQYFIEITYEGRFHVLICNHDELFWSLDEAEGAMYEHAKAEGFFNG